MSAAKRVKRAAAVLLGAALAGGVVVTAMFVSKRRISTVISEVPAQTAEEFANPDRGVCPLLGWTLGQDLSLLTGKLNHLKGASLVLVEINLKNYRDREIDASALQSLNTFLDQYRTKGPRLILRFVYDTNGTAALTEPDSLETILMHMRQVGPLLAEHADSIYTLQGLFTGNWGEMNGSRFSDAESLRRLYTCLRESTGEKVRLAVRTPAQWRTIQKADVTEELAVSSGLGLFNDGMTGSETDYGTYAEESAENAPGLTDAWPRQQELEFQERLCRYEPDGGEVIHPCAWNDLDQAVQSFSQMHVSYLNPDYDPDVWEKWKKTTVTEDGVFDGTDGAAYIRCHLGYRYVLTGSDVTYGWWHNQICVSLTFQNIGFAPAYRTVTPVLTLCTGAGEVVQTQMLSDDLSALPGGTDSDREMHVQASFAAGGLESGIYTLELSLRYGDDQSLALGNVPDEPGRSVYTAGTVTVR